MRRRWIVVLLACSLLLAVGPIWMLFPSPGVHIGAFNRIQKGMFESEVHAVLGGPPGDYRSNPGPGPFYASFLRPIGGIKKDWFGDSLDIHVGFDSHNRVLWKCCTHKSSESSRSLWDRVFGRFAY